MKIREEITFSPINLNIVKVNNPTCKNSNDISLNKFSYFLNLESDITSIKQRDKYPNDTVTSWRKMKTTTKSSAKKTSRIIYS